MIAKVFEDLAAAKLERTRSLVNRVVHVLENMKVERKEMRRVLPMSVGLEQAKHKK